MSNNVHIHTKYHMILLSTELAPFLGDKDDTEIGSIVYTDNS